MKTMSFASAIAVGMLATVPSMAEEHTVAIKNFKFEPATLSAVVGDTITFVNEDSAPHTATALDGAFDTGRLSKGERATVTVGTSGEIAYKCDVHPSMTGKVVAQ